MPDVTRIVETIFKANTAQFTSALGNLGAASGAAGGAVSNLSTSLSTALIGAVQKAAGGAVGLFEKIAEIGSAAEQARIQIAGFMTGLGLAPDINKGLEDSDNIMKKIIIDSAKLPGEAEDYITVFKMGLPQVSAAMQGTTDDFVKFTNQISAVGISFGINAENIGRDVQKMLAPGAGMAGMRVRTFASMLPFLRKLEGQAGLTAQSFNAMSDTKRLDLLQRALGSLQPMLDKMSDSWESQTGALASNTRLIARMASAGMFDKMKDVLHDINGLLFDADGNLTNFSQTIVSTGKVLGTNLIGAWDTIIDRIKDASGYLEDMGNKLASMPGLKNLDQAIGGVAGNLANGPLGAARMPFEAAKTFLGRDEDVAKTVDGLATALGTLLNFLEPVTNLFGKIGSILGEALGELLPALFSTVNAVLGPVTDTLGAVINTIIAIFDAIHPTISGLLESLSYLWTSIGDVLHPALRGLGYLLEALWSLLKVVVVPIFTLLGKVISFVIDRLADLLSGLGAALTALLPAEQQKAAGGGPGFFEKLMKSIEEQSDRDKAADAAKKAAARAAPGQRAGAEVYQDFRGSRFDVTQKFAEGFDPDRIAVAFAKDVERIGEMRLQSGLETPFGVR